LGKGPNPLDAEEGEGTDTPTIAEEDEPNVDPVVRLKSCSMDAVVRRDGLSKDHHKRCGFIEWCCTY